MNFSQAVILFFAALLAGAINAVAGGGSYSCRYRCGALDAAAAKALIHHIEAVGRDAGNASWIGA